uniref:Nucleoporin p58/p45 n=1 Tax=Rhabditophanes sp. KR3021 TaxID=114890 RepID=A0AC35UDW0_9BILA
MLSANPTQEKTKENCNPLDGEVPQVLLDQYKQLESAIKENGNNITKYALNSAESCLKIEEKVNTVKLIMVDEKKSFSTFAQKLETLKENSQKDYIMVEMVMKLQELLKNGSQSGAQEVRNYMFNLVNEHAKMVEDFREKIDKLNILIDKELECGNEYSELSSDEVFEDLTRFDSHIKAVGNQIRQIQDAMDILKLEYMEDQKKKYGRFAQNPFDKPRQRDNLSSTFHGKDVMPSNTTLVKLGNMITPAPTTQAPATGLFGATQPSTSLFGAKPAGGSLFGNTGASSTLFGAAQPASSSLFGTTQPATGSSLFGAPQPTTGSSLFGAAQPATSSLFGTAQPASQAGKSSLFGSAQPATGGSLFGAAQGPTAPTNTSLFGTPQASGNTSLFGTAQPASGSSLFGNQAAKSSLFGAAQPATGGTSLFGTAQPATGGTSLFGTAQPASSSLFGTASTR